MRMTHDPNPHIPALATTSRSAVAREADETRAFVGAAHAAAAAFAVDRLLVVAGARSAERSECEGPYWSVE
jgi:hypothetical protein